MQVDGLGQVGPSGQTGQNGSAEPQPGFPMDAAKELHSFEIDPKRVSWSAWTKPSLHAEGSREQAQIIHSRLRVEQACLAARSAPPWTLFPCRRNAAAGCL